MKSRMPNSHTLLALLLSGAAVGAQEIQPVIDRPLTLPKGRLDLTLHGTYTNWGNSSSAGAGPSSLTGETLALGADLGANDQVPLAHGLSLPLNPGAAIRFLPAI